MARLILNGWKIDFYPGLFEAQYETLITSVQRLVDSKREDVASHPDVELLKSLQLVFEEVSQDPTASQFRLGNTIGDGNWRRVKGRLPARRRLFFRFSTSDKRVIFAWLNDEDTLRKEGARTDVYAVFEAMLKRGTPPRSFPELASAVDNEAARKAAAGAVKLPGGDRPSE